MPVLYSPTLSSKQPLSQKFPHRNSVCTSCSRILHVQSLAAAGCPYPANSGWTVQATKFVGTWYCPKITTSDSLGSNIYLTTVHCRWNLIFFSHLFVCLWRFLFNTLFAFITFPFKSHVRPFHQLWPHALKAALHVMPTSPLWSPNVVP